jgi:hypothetical protein
VPGTSRRWLSSCIGAAHPWVGPARSADGPRPRSRSTPSPRRPSRDDRRSQTHATACRGGPSGDADLTRRSWSSWAVSSSRCGWGRPSEDRAARRVPAGLLPDRRLRVQLVRLGQGFRRGLVAVDPASDDLGRHRAHVAVAIVPEAPDGRTEHHRLRRTARRVLAPIARERMQGVPPDASVVIVEKPHTPFGMSTNLFAWRAGDICPYRV